MKLDLKKVGELLFHGSLDFAQEAGVEAIIKGCMENGITMKEQIAYCLATAYWETGRHMCGIDEFGKGAGRKYGTPDTVTGHIYYGRGLVQLTWAGNYKEFSKVVGVDLYHSPELANRLDIAVKIMVIGMKKGMFTGVGLDRFINQNQCDFLDARKIINGTDQAAKIAGFAKIFEDNLSA